MFLNSFCFCFTGKRKRAASSTANRRTKFLHLKKMAVEASYKDSKYPSHGVIEEFEKLNNLDGAPGPCGFRPFEFDSKLKIENQTFTIVIFNVWFLKDWKSQIYNLLFHRFQLIKNSNLTKLFMCNETAGNSINDDEIRNENRFLIFVVEKNKNWKQTKYNCDGWGRVKPEVARLQTRWRSSCSEVFVEPSLGEM